MMVEATLEMGWEVGVLLDLEASSSALVECGKIP